jgi:hypothetical protein
VIVWATTVSTVTSRGGHSIALNPNPDPAGSYAAYYSIGGRLLARPLHKGEDHDHRVEQRAMPHVATCLKAETRDLLDGINQMLDEVAYSEDRCPTCGRVVDCCGGCSCEKP